MAFLVLGYLGLGEQPVVCTHIPVRGRATMVCEGSESFEVFSQTREPVIIEGNFLLLDKDTSFYLIKSGQYEHAYMSYNSLTEEKKLLFKIETPPSFARN